jgi:hypothetical protein
MIEAVQQIARTNERALEIQIGGFDHLQRAIRERSPDKEIAAIVSGAHSFGWGEPVGA